MLKKHKYNGYVKYRICAELGHRKELAPIFEELEDIENQKTESLFGLSVAQILGLILIDNGNKNDIQHLISKINKWRLSVKRKILSIF
ncbi:MAG: hypothetical protein Q4B43_11255 [Bacteroidota bacterium]|nr:hypothetical protein [Bacteroidota bacterium]